MRVKNITILLFLCLGLSYSGFCKKQIPVIKANSKIVNIKDGNDLLEGYWTIEPHIKLDVYETRSKEVTFYTDIDSITFKINPKVKEYNFIILLNGKDTAYTQIAAQEPYLNKLKKAKKYNYKDTRYIPQFTYQSMNDPNLVKIRKEFNLDSIAGGGNEISKILNLMHWLHNTIRHDGSSNNPQSQNAIDIINICKQENRGVNCRMLAMILNECYLSMGIKSRYITCMPKETEFNDCHVINMVFSEDLGKWIWIDPSFDAYVMDEKGELLGIEEVRKRLIDGSTLILNPDANWNRQFSYTKEYYLDDYMAKNLYRLQCPVSSEYNSETRTDGKKFTFVELLPLDGIEQEPQKSNHKVAMKENLNVEFMYYKTNNPDLFWAKP